MRHAILLAALLTAAAVSGDWKGEHVMSSGNLQPYNIPFSGLVPPIRPESTINDEFKAQHPPAAPPLGTPGYVALDAKWTPWDPGGALNTMVIDPRRQMLLMESGDGKAWCGAMQDLPLPALGESIAYQLYSRTMLGVNGPEQPSQDFGPYLGGLVLGVDLRGNPSTSDLWSIHYRLGGDTGVVSGAMESAHFDDFDFPYVPLVTAECGWPLTFMRANVVTSQDAPGVYQTNLFFAVSPTGEGYATIAGYEIAQPLRQFALAQRGESLGQSFASFHDYVRYHVVIEGVDVSGARQQIGSV